MNIIISVAIALEIIAALFIVWGIFHEDVLVRFEKDLFRNIKKSLDRSAKKRAVKKSRALNKRASYRPVKPVYGSHGYSESAA